MFPSFFILFLAPFSHNELGHEFGFRIRTSSPSSAPSERLKIRGVADHRHQQQGEQRDGGERTMEAREQRAESLPICSVFRFVFAFFVPIPFSVFHFFSSDCDFGRFGPSCAHSCEDCQNGGGCDRRKSHCECAPGWQGGTLTSDH